MIVVNEERCIGCSICSHFCPVDALEGWGVICVNQERCKDCLFCIGCCPVDALEIKH